jgi:hypothetical protein
MQLKRLIITPYPAKPLLGFRPISLSRVRGSSRAVFEARGGSTRKGAAWEGPNNICMLVLYFAQARLITQPWATRRKKLGILPSPVQRFSCTQLEAEYCALYILIIYRT